MVQRRRVSCVGLVQLGVTLLLPERSAADDEECHHGDDDEDHGDAECYPVDAGHFGSGCMFGWNRGITVVYRASVQDKSWRRSKQVMSSSHVDDGFHGTSSAGAEQ